MTTKLRRIADFLPPRSAANYEAHKRAVSFPSSDQERAIIFLGWGIERYAQVIYDSGAHGIDGVLSEGIGQMLEGFRTLLNGDLGRLDGGSLDAWAGYTAAAVGYDLNLSAMAWDSPGGVDAVRKEYGIEDPEGNE